MLFLKVFKVGDNFDSKLRQFHIAAPLHESIIGHLQIIAWEFLDNASFDFFNTVRAMTTRRFTHHRGFAIYLNWIYENVCHECEK